MNTTRINFAFAYERAAQDKVAAIQRTLEAQHDLQRIHFESQQSVVRAKSEVEALELQRSIPPAVIVRERELDLERRAIDKRDGHLPQATQGVPFFGPALGAHPDRPAGAHPDEGLPSPGRNLPRPEDGTLSLRFLVVPLAVAALVAGPAASVDAEGAAATSAAPVKVLRRMQFAIEFGESSATETKVSGLEGGGSTSGHSTDSNGDVNARGTITVEVVAASSDGGLVVDVSENAASRDATPVRVGILDDNVMYDPKRNVTEEERTLLRYLARGFVKPTELAKGTTWQSTSPAKGVTDETTYSVTAVDPDAKTVALDFKGSTNVVGVNGFTANTQGSMTYDTGVSVPLKFTLWRKTYVQNPGRLTTIDMKFSGSLVSDSIHKDPKA